MSPRATLTWGIVLALAAVALAGVGGAIKGPANPECAGFAAFSTECRDARLLGGTMVQMLALPVGVAGGVLVAVWLGRRAQAEDAQADDHER